MASSTSIHMEKPLSGKWIVITRPKHQAEPLRQKLEAVGANVILFPLLDIVPPDNIAQTQQQLAQIENNDLLIFTSANAVNHSLKWLQKSNLCHLKVAAIGKKTANLLKDKGIQVDYFPSQNFNSEALLAMPEIQSYGEGKTVAIIRGQNGRDYLREKLEDQAVRVEYIDVYKRILPQQNIQLLSEHYSNNQIDIILISSGSILQNLFKFLPENAWLNKTRILLGSERISTIMSNQYPSYQGELLVTSDPSDETFYQKLIEWSKDISI